MDRSGFNGQGFLQVAMVYHGQKVNSTTWLYGLSFNNILDSSWKRCIILRSNDGVSWKQQRATQQIYCMKYLCNGLWVVVGQKGTVLTSSDGISWYQQLKNIASTLANAYDNGIYVAIGSFVNFYEVI